MASRGRSSPDCSAASQEARGATGIKPGPHAAASSTPGSAAIAGTPFDGAISTADYEELQQSSRLTALMLREQRPRTRGECKEGLRPCPWVGCRHHLLIEVKAPSGNAKRVRHPPVLRLNTVRVRKGLSPYAAERVVQGWLDAAIEEIESMPETCSLDVADRGPRNDVQLAETLHVSKQAAHIYAARALVRLKIGLAEAEIEP